MKVELSIKDDKELRDLIKDMIRGQVMSLARESVVATIKAETIRKLNDSYMHAELRGILSSERANILSEARIQIAKIFEKEVADKIAEVAGSLVKNAATMVDLITPQVRKIVNDSIDRRLKNIKLTIE